MKIGKRDAVPRSFDRLDPGNRSGSGWTSVEGGRRRLGSWNAHRRASELALRKCTDEYKRDMMLFIEFHTIVVRDKVPVEAAHRAFLAIDEYRDRISPDIEGATPGDAFGGWGVP